MRAMILAAGLGTRLRPLTNDRPKALVEVAGHTMLEIALLRLRACGIRDVIVNAHHFADLLIAYLRDRANFGMHIEISREDLLLDTGGGLKKAAPFFLQANGNSGAPFLLHNVDVVSTIDLERMLQFHLEHGALATLAVQRRTSSRQLLFDEQGQLCGRRTAAGDELAQAATNVEPLAFSGIHILSPRLLAELHEEGAFSIIPSYLRLAGTGEKILAFRSGQYYWRDLGRPESVAQAARDLEAGAWQIDVG